MQEVFGENIGSPGYRNSRIEGKVALMQMKLEVKWRYWTVSTLRWLWQLPLACKHVQPSCWVATRDLQWCDSAILEHQTTTSNKFLACLSLLVSTPSAVLRFEQAGTACLPPEILCTVWWQVIFSDLSAAVYTFPPLNHMLKWLPVT